MGKAIAVLTKRLNFASSEDEAAVNEGLSRCNLENGDHARALQYAEAALSISTSRDMNARQQMKATFMVGSCLYRTHRYNEAVVKFGNYLDLARALGDRSEEAMAMTHLGNTHLQLGEVHKSIHLQQQAL